MSLHLAPRGPVLDCGSRSTAVHHRARLPACRSSKPELTEPVTSTSTSTTDAFPAGRARAAFKASKLGRQTVVEAQRPLAEYMALPASQYSVLDAGRIERVDESTFRCYVGELRFLSWSVEPVITVSVTVEEGGCTIRLLGCKLQGSRFVDDINDKFSATMTNMVRFRDYVPPLEEVAQDAGEGPSTARRTQKEIVSDTVIQVCLEVPAWCGFVPVSSIESAGSSVMQGVLNAMVPRFLAQLQTDYELWAGGDGSRQPVGEI